MVIYGNENRSQIMLIAQLGTSQKTLLISLKMWNWRWFRDLKIGIRSNESKCHELYESKKANYSVKNNKFRFLKEEVGKMRANCWSDRFLSRKISAKPKANYEKLTRFLGFSYTIEQQTFKINWILSLFLMFSAKKDAAKNKKRIPKANGCCV